MPGQKMNTQRATGQLNLAPTYSGAARASFRTDVLQGERDVMLARADIAEAFYRGGDLLALENARKL
jgi:hypothetical protein